MGRVIRIPIGTVGILLALLSSVHVAWGQGQCGVSKTFTAEVLTPGDLNTALVTASTTNSTLACVRHYSSTVAQMRLNTDPGAVGTEVLATTAAGEIERLRYAILRLHGLDVANREWYSNPSPMQIPGDLHVGLASTRSNRVMFSHSGTAFTTSWWSGNATATANYFWPPAPPTATGQFITSDTAGQMSWTTGTVAATQAEMEAASDTTVSATAGRTQYHPGVAKAWGQWNNAGAIDVSYNLTSITDTGVGDHTVVIATDFSSANWAGLATGASSNAVVNIASKAAGTANIIGRDLSTDPPPAAALDLSVWNFVGFGDQ